MVNSRSKGKRVELDVAHRLGVGRNPADGHSHTDIYYKQYAIEVKARAKFWPLLHSAMQQAVDDLKGERTIPIVVLVETAAGQKPVRYVVSRFEDFFNEGNE